MPPSQSTSAQTDAPSLATTARGDDIYRSIIDLADRVKAKPAFYLESFRRVATYFSSPYAAVSLSLTGQVVEDQWHTGPTNPQMWKEQVQAFLTECLAENTARARRLSQKNSDQTVALIASPVADRHNHPVGAIAMVVEAQDTHRVGSLLAELRALTSVMSVCAERLEPNTGRNGSAGASDPCAVAAHAAAYSSKHEMAFAITNNLRNKVGCDQVALGMVTRRHVQVLSISGLDHVPPRSPGVSQIRAAMEECLDRQEPILYQKDDDWDHDQSVAAYRLHQQWSNATGQAAVVSVPIVIQGRCLGILSCRQPGDQPFRREEIEKLQRVMAAWIPGLLLVERASRGYVALTRQAVRQGLRAIFRPSGLMRAALVMAVMLCVGWFAVGTMDYRITVPCAVTPAQLQHVVAPFNGVIRGAYVTAGDKVVAGQVLCELDTAELELERDRIVANIDVFRIELDRSISSHTAPVEAKLARAQLGALQAQLRSTALKLERSVVRAPADGTVVTGDLRKRINQVVHTGEPMFEIAPNSGWVLELSVPESSMADVMAGQVGKFVPNAQPERAQTCRIARVRPASEQRRGRNVFVAEADIDTRIRWLRAGMEGVTRIEIGRRRAWWVVLHRLVDFVRLKIWV